jgi:hypothetical protein
MVERTGSLHADAGPPDGTVLDRILRIPLDFWRRGNPSVLQLLDESGYFEDSTVITSASVGSHLEHHPALFRAWEILMSDRRCEGWFVIKRDGGVELQHSDGRRAPYGDYREAFIALVVNEIGDWAYIVERMKVSGEALTKEYKPRRPGPL